MTVSGAPVTYAAVIQGGVHATCISHRTTLFIQLTSSSLNERERAKVGFVPIWNSRLQTIAAAVCNVNGTAYRHSGSQRYSPMRRYVRSFIHPRQRRKMLTAFKATLIVYSDGLAIFRTVGYMRLAVPYTQQDDYSPWHGPRLFHSPAISKICCEREAEKRILMKDQKWQLGWPSFDHHCWPRRTRNVAKDRR